MNCTYAVGATLLAAPQGADRSDVSGRWTREPGPAQGAGKNPGNLGTEVSITRNGADITVHPVGSAPSRYRVDGSEVSSILSAEPCARRTRVTRAVESGTGVRITSWIVSQQNCMHGESNLFATPDPESVAAAQAGFGGRATSSSTRALEAITVISRDGDKLSVETTESLPNGTTRTTTAGYRAVE